MFFRVLTGFEKSSIIGGLITADSARRVEGSGLEFRVLGLVGLTRPTLILNHKGLNIVSSGIN